MRLLFVDDQLTMLVLGRLLAPWTRDALLADDASGDIKKDIARATLPADLNSALVAACLADMGAGVIPDISKQPPTYLDQPVRLEGRITGVEAGPEQPPGTNRIVQVAPSLDLRFRVQLDDGASILLRLNGAVSYRWTAPELKGRRILAVGLLRRPRYRHVLAATIMQLMPPPPSSSQGLRVPA
jgi:hypothetical protein